MTESNRNDKNRPTVDRQLHQLQKRAGELDCLYRVEEALAPKDATLEEICRNILEAIPRGWQYPEVCVAQIAVDHEVFESPGFITTPWGLSVNIVVSELPVGQISIYYTKDMPKWDIGPFLKQEAKLIQTIADRLAHRIAHRGMQEIVAQLDKRQPSASKGSANEWQIVLQMLTQTDRNLYTSVSRKMLNHMCWSGITEAELLLQTSSPDPRELEESMLEDWNQPYESSHTGFSPELCGTVFKIAADNLSDEEIFRLVQKWIQEDKLSFLVHVVNRNLSLADVADAIRRYHYLAEHEPEIQSPNERGIAVSLIRRFLSDQLKYISVAKNYIRVRDFYYLLDRVVFSADSHGKLGGKSAGLYLARQILKKKARTNELLADVRIPKTYHITSDVMLHFMHHNDFDEVVEQKYKPMNQVRLEYPRMVQTFKNARFPADIVNGLSVALDDLGDHPLIVRSSSLLEDRVGAVFSGKYKSVFVANQGTKQQRLEALLDAVAEVYASTFGPDPIEYRSERGLIDFGEEMGIMIQRVVGTRVGRYFLPMYAGVGFSKNEFRWSPRIKREDGLIRLVPGLGTRAVDRLSDDYPVLIAPGQPGLRVNTIPSERVRYSPKKIDVINLETNAFETINIEEFLSWAGEDMPGIENMVSEYQDGLMRTPTGMTFQLNSRSAVVTFDGLVQRTQFVKRLKAILETLEEEFGFPVDIEFASDGKHFYLLQCRSLSHSEYSSPAPIPRDVPKGDVVFSAKKYISNGWMPDITHLIYVDPQKYSQIEDKTRMIDVGKTVSRLNQILPKRQFVLMGPGRWGSRGDIKLGVSVTYSDINNTAALIEVARQKGNYVPELSFGTHFFQDLVEADIRYLPLYPDDPDTLFNERFLLESENVLGQIAPEFADLGDVVRLIDVPGVTDGKVLRILLNADLEEGLGLLVEPSQDIGKPSTETGSRPTVVEHAWRWRLRMAKQIAASLDPKKYGVVAFYVFGSTKNATAGPASDINVLIHFRGSPEQQALLQSWLEGWSFSLAEMNYMQTGHQTDGLLDVHFITDQDIADRTKWAAKIGAATDAAQSLPLKSQADD